MPHSSIQTGTCRQFDPHSDNTEEAPNVFMERRLSRRRSFAIPSWHEVRRFARDITHRSVEEAESETHKSKRGLKGRNRSATASPTSLNEAIDAEEYERTPLPHQPAEKTGGKDELKMKKIFGFRRHSYDAMEAEPAEETLEENLKGSIHQRAQAFFHAYPSGRQHRRSRATKYGTKNYCDDEASSPSSHAILSPSKRSHSSRGSIDSGSLTKRKLKKYLKFAMMHDSLNSDEEKDRDLQQERRSFTKRVFEKKRYAPNSPTETESSSPCQLEDDALAALNDTTRHVSFRETPTYFPDDTTACYIELEHYEDIFERVACFAAHDQRRKARKIREFLERTLAFLNQSDTKHGIVTKLSNEEIRMWRRVISHDWDAEETTSTDQQDLVGLVDAEHGNFQQSLATDLRTEWKAPDELEQLEKIVEIVNSCVSFGEIPFSLLSIAKLCQLEFVQESEEDGWL
uniref:Uncharacterized protein AlNc14C390G11277 n=1 Tax=Albugo laibachii Nc14 TaxID=890382 RepID=F0WYL3_9STRA|nr:conserved hypothetical protein [Albugo laibachii Nc14]CCA26878.1 conserved hypothetical protein [Albugo laibachii Nc14]|eukprot:CCA26878.1 conserved hypothetical protein [Albugo laibachii Nc14]